MSVRMVLLGLLHERPLYGYEIKHIIEDHMGDWTSIAFGSIYFALDKLAEEGFVEKVATEQEGNRPSRTVFQVTPRGEEEFLHLLRDGWQDVARQYFEIDVCLFFLDRLSPQEIQSYLKSRLARLEATLDGLREHENEQFQNPHVPPQARAIFDHTRLHLESEVQWTRKLLHSLEDGMRV
jgi:DNA-binding PadR family transcriptional regulator